MADSGERRPPSILSSIRRAQNRQQGDGRTGEAPAAAAQDDAPKTPPPDGGPPAPPPASQADDDADDTTPAGEAGEFEIPGEQLKAFGPGTDTRWRFEQWARNPECRANAISAVRGIPMADVATLEGLEPSAEQSTFLLSRAVTFERELFADDAERLRTLLSEAGVLAGDAHGFADLRTRFRGGPEPSPQTAAAATDALLRRIARGDASAPSVIAGAAVRMSDEDDPHSVVTMDVLAVASDGETRELVVGIIKSFPDRGGHTEPRELTTARAQAGLYLYALRQHVERLRLGPSPRVRDDGFVVMTRPASLIPVLRTGEDLGFQAERARRGLEMLRAASEDAASFEADTQSPEETLAEVETTYRESCVGFCERAEQCHAVASDAADPVILGDDAKRFLGSIALPRALELLDGSAALDAAEEDLARRMRQGEERAGGSKGSDVVRRLRAYEAGRPLDCGATLHSHIAADEDLLIVAFVRMGGESRPWGIAFGHPGARPTVLTVPEGRDRDLVAGMCAEFAPVLLKHLRAPGYIADADTTPTDLTPLRQLWLPSSGHLDMLHHLAYAYLWWQGDRQDALNALGRACGWLFREAQRPGQQHVVVATKALTDAYTFPAQNVRQQHLGYLLAWLATDGDVDARMQAATEAEKLPVSTVLHPQFEREEMEPLVNRWGRVRRRGEDELLTRTATRISARLEPELLRRFELTERAIAALRRDRRPAMRGMDSLVTAAVEEQWREYTSLELRLADPDGEKPFIASPETDVLPVVASRRYLVHLMSQKRLTGLLLHNDPELLEEAVVAGDAFRGTVVSVGMERDVTWPRPVWTVRSREQGQLRLRPDSWVCVAGHPDLTCVLRTLTDLPEGGREFQVAFNGSREAKQAASVRDHEGRQVVIVSDYSVGLLQRQISRISDEPGPGEWLTHAPSAKTSSLSDGEETSASASRGSGDD